MFWSILKLVSMVNEPVALVAGVLGISMYCASLSSTAPVPVALPWPAVRCTPASMPVAMSKVLVVVGVTLFRRKLKWLCWSLLL